jgi:hypothetical protein
MIKWFDGPSSSCPSPSTEEEPEEGLYTLKTLRAGGSAGVGVDIVKI